jgi:GNAT superfamily N-acetyltransferase
MVMRPARASDIPFVLASYVRDAIQPSTDDAEGRDPAYAEALAAIDADPAHELWIAELAGTPVGTFQLSYLPGLARRGRLRGQLESFHVEPGHRSRGIGAAMVRFAIERCRARGCVLLQLTSHESRTRAHAFYTRLGFSKSHAGFKLAL